MDIGSILVLLALLIMVGVYVARPIVEKQAVAITEEEQILSTVMAARDQILDTLQELDFDYQLGKIPEEEYPAQRARLLEQGAAILQQLDAIQGVPGVQDDVEKAIAARRASLAQAANGGPNSRRHLKAPDDDIETLIAARRRERHEKSAGFCPQCGHPVQKSDKFCSKCGHTLA